jgi:hypothetical protein
VRDDRTQINCNKPKNPKTTQKADTMTQTSDTQRGSKQADDKNAVRLFHVNFPEGDLTDLRRRINATNMTKLTETAR